MHISKIRIHNFGKLQNKEINFTKNINILYGANESGKSTVLAFIKACLYGLSSRGNLSERKRYTPWINLTPMGGEMYFEFNNVKYRYVCTFGKSKRNDEATLYNDSTGEPVQIPSGITLGEYLFSLSEGAFDSSIFAPQLQSKIDGSRDKDGQLLSLIAKSQGSEDDSVNIVERRLKSALDSIKAPRSTNGILDKLYILKKANEDMLLKLKEEEGKLKEIKKELNTLVMEQEEIESSIAIFEAKEKLKQKQVILAQMAKIDSLHDNIKSNDNNSIKNGANRLYVLFVIMLLLASITNFLPLPAPLILLPLGLALMSLFLAVKSKAKTHNISLIMKELEKEEALLDHFLGDKTLSDHEEEWKSAESFLESVSPYFNDNLEKLINRKEELKELITFKKAQIQTREISHDYANLLEKKKEIDKKIAYYENKYEAISIAYETIKESYNELQTIFGPKVSEKTSEILKELTLNEHDNVRVSKELDIFIDEQEGYYGNQYYSGGTIDQIYLAFRLAVSSIIAPFGTLPLYLDEPFVQYDDSRLNNALLYLQKFNSLNNNQIILTSCQKRILPHVSNMRQINVIHL